MFSDAEKVFMKNIGIDVNFDDMSDGDYMKVEEAVSLHLQKNGFDKEYKPTKEGTMCENILDKL